jgi:hypothetical protein
MEKSQKPPSVTAAPAQGKKPLKLRVAFSSIDAKDSASGGYRACGFVFYDELEHLGPKNEALNIEMNREYLTRLRQLQEEINDKYLELYDANEPLSDKRADIDEEAIYEAARAKFPGSEAPYYT